MRRISREDLRRYLEKGERLTIVEALPERYWREGHLPGAIRIDHTEVGEKAPSLLPDKGSKIVVYCASTECQNSTKAARALESLGYENVHEYAEGKQDWAEAGLPLVSEE